ncbi:MAG: hypothetical protein QW698_05695 [Nitrososphaerales archaeon]
MIREKEGGKTPLFVEYLASISPLCPIINYKYGCEIFPLDSAIIMFVSKYALRTYGLQSKPAFKIASLMSLVTKVVLKKSFFLIPRGSKPRSGESLVSLSQSLILSSKYSLM